MRDNSFMRQHVRAAHICASLHLVLKAPFVRSKAASYSCWDGSRHTTTELFSLLWNLDNGEEQMITSLIPCLSNGPGI